VVLIVVLTFVTAGLLLAATMTFIGVGEIQSSRSLSSGEGTLSFVEGCAEDAILKVRANVSYAGGMITRPEGTCNVTASAVGTVWTVKATTAATNYTRTVQVVFTRGVNSITITSWTEI